MNGAREYSNLNLEGQHGRLFVSMSSHARGKTISIQILPEGVKAELNCGLLTHRCLNKDIVEVYGVTGGNRGWTETYGWLHKGPWVKDFEEIVKQKKELKAKREESKLLKEKTNNQDEQSRVKALLDGY